MRTKALFLTAALGVASIATSMAQVYSVNAVGYVNVSIPLAGTSAKVYAILANPLNGTNNLIETIIPTAPEDTVVYLFTGTAYRTVYYGGPGLWAADDGQPVTLNPGEGFFLELDRAKASNPTVLTFVGEVPQGQLVNPVPKGFSLRGSIVPQSGRLQSDLGYNPDEAGNDQVFDFNVATQSYDTYYYGGGGAWANSLQTTDQPVLNPGRGMFFFNAGNQTINWTRNFTVQ